MEPVRDVDHPPGRPTGVPGNGSAIYRQSAGRLPIGPRLPCSACPRRTRGRSGTGAPGLVRRTDGGPTAATALVRQTSIPATPLAVPFAPFLTVSFM